MSTVLWLALAVLFAAFAVFHLVRARKELPLAPNNAKVKSINGVPLGIADFIDSFNGYVTELNRDSRITNLVAGVANIAASLAALASAFATM